MSKANASMRKLKALAGNGLPPKETWAGHESELYTAPARSCVLVASAALDATLQQGLKGKFLKSLTADDLEEIFGTEKPLGSFSAKIKLSYAVGLIDADTRRNLDYIRQLRNVFAHATRPLAFDTPEVAAVIKMLTPSDAWPKEMLEEPRNWFLSACVRAGKSVAAAMR